MAAESSSLATYLVFFLSCFCFFLFFGMEGVFEHIITKLLVSIEDNNN